MQARGRLSDRGRMCRRRRGACDARRV